MRYWNGISDSETSRIRVAFTFLHELWQPSDPLPSSGSFKVGGGTRRITIWGSVGGCRGGYRNVSHRDPEINGMSTHILIHASNQIASKYGCFLCRMSHSLKVRRCI